MAQGVDALVEKPVFFEAKRRQLIAQIGDDAPASRDLGVQALGLLAGVLAPNEGVASAQPLDDEKADLVDMPMLAGGQRASFGEERLNEFGRGIVGGEPRGAADDQIVVFERLDAVDSRAQRLDLRNDSLRAVDQPGGLPQSGAGPGR